MQNKIPAAYPEGTLAAKASVRTAGQFQDQYTPGPWRAQGTGIYAQVDGKPYLLANCASDTSTDHPRILQGCIDARLIAAAPSLAAALRAMVNWDEKWKAGERTDKALETIEDVLEQARSALADIDGGKE